MSFSLLFLMLATEKMKRYLYVSTHFRSCGTIHGALKFKGTTGWTTPWPQTGKNMLRSLTTAGLEPEASTPGQLHAGTSLGQSRCDPEVQENLSHGLPRFLTYLWLLLFIRYLLTS